ncbi:hypothetical protein P8452_33056 [Trifolium repens]|nr:hypothetical protein P8452_33056 [Trifolium repens]
MPASARGLRRDYFSSANSRNAKCSLDIGLFSDMNYPFHSSFYPSWVLSLLSSSRHGLYIYSGHCVLLVTFTFKSGANFSKLTLSVALENGGCLRLSMRRSAWKGYMAFQC